MAYGCKGIARGGEMMIHVLLAVAAQPQTGVLSGTLALSSLQ